jgi:anti-anti-sigma regulatory factor
MMKVEVKMLDGRVVLQVDGRLAGPFVPELERCWHAAQAAQPKRGVALDLRNVTCVDRAGRRLLESMHSSGVGFLRAGLAIDDILEEVMEESKCKQ